MRLRIARVHDVSQIFELILADEVAAIDTVGIDDGDAVIFAAALLDRYAHPLSTPSIFVGIESHEDDGRRGAWPRGDQVSSL